MSSKKDGGEKILSKYRKTRKAFFIEYLCAAALFVILIFSLAKGANLSPNFYYLIGVLGVVSLSYAELSRIMRRYIIKESKIVIIEGLIKHHKKHIYFHPLGFVPDINVKQGWLERILNYGTISMRVSDEVFQIKDINSPHKVMGQIEERMVANKGSMPASYDQMH